MSIYRYLPIENGDVPSFFVCLPGRVASSNTTKNSGESWSRPSPLTFWNHPRQTSSGCGMGGWGLGESVRSGWPSFKSKMTMQKQMIFPLESTSRGTIWPIYDDLPIISMLIFQFTTWKMTIYGDFHAFVWTRGREYGRNESSPQANEAWWNVVPQ